MSHLVLVPDTRVSPDHGSGAARVRPSSLRSSSPRRAPVRSAGGRDAALPPLRLTARGRLALRVLSGTVLTALVLGLVALFYSSWSAQATAGESGADSSAVRGEFSTVTVQEGDSLWTIADASAPGADPRDLMADIVEINDLRSGVVHPGQELAIPAS